jgi:putative ABC transport system ATP-binding protein
VLSVSHDPEWMERCDIVFELETGILNKVERHGNP